MSDIMLDRERLRTANEGLVNSIAEFTDAAKNNDALENSIGRPDDRGSLRDKASDFESSWNAKREALLENLTGIQEHLQGILDGWDTMDTEAAASLTSATPTTVHAQVR
jgi:hypothetical protein